MTWELQDWLGVGRISTGELWSLFFALAATIMQVSCNAGLCIADAGNAAVSEVWPGVRQSLLACNSDRSRLRVWTSLEASLH